MENFKNRVIALIKKIPRGKVASYGQIAALAGSPKAARQVGGVLRGLDSNSLLPWWRVINSKGEISIKGNWAVTKEMQKSLLIKERVKVSMDYKINMGDYQWKGR